MTLIPESVPLSRWRAALDRLVAVELRDWCFWFGLALLWTGVAGESSPWLASAVVGTALFLVAVFGVASSRGN
jgi:hypothetical protein